MKKIIFLLALVIISCSKEEVVLHSPYIGEYKTVSITSDTAMDLNRDGITSNDFKKELSIYYDRYSLIQPTLILYSYPEPLRNTIDDFIPRQYLDPIISMEEFSKASASNSITYNQNFTEVVAIDRYFSEEFLIQQRIAHIDEVKLLPNKQIKIHYRQQFHTTATGWQTCKLEVLYKPLK